jgi:hypothetical protein
VAISLAAARTSSSMARVVRISGPFCENITHQSSYIIIWTKETPDQNRDLGFLSYLICVCYTAPHFFSGFLAK